MKSIICELCNGDAAVYCLSDSAFLCWNCDSNVHEANFLVARHIRQTICSKCKQLDGNNISGVGLRPLPPICRSCSPEESYDSDCSCTSSTSTCISSSSGKSSFTSNRQRTPAKKMKTQAYSSTMDKKAEAILVNWSRKLGVKSSNNTLIAFALHAFTICLARITTLPFRVTLASSFWLALKLNKEVAESTESTCQVMRRLEDISGVPAKLILLSEKKMARVLKINRKPEVDLTEGWAECSN